MSLFRRAIRIFLIVAALVGALVTAIAAFFARRVTSPPRLPTWAQPSDLGLDYEPIQFPAREDGTRLVGWFLPGAGDGAQKPAIVLIHGWMWNRLGDIGEGMLAVTIGASIVDLLQLAQPLQAAGYHIVMYDARNHGESATTGSSTFGYQEANDVLGAVDYLRSRTDVDSERIGAIGFSSGANAALYALARTEWIKAAVAVQPTSPEHFVKRMARHLAGPLALFIVPLTETFVSLMGGMRFSATDPLTVAPSTGGTPVLFVQGSGDPWGSVDNVDAIAAATPNSIDTVIVVETVDRYSGYRYVVEHPELPLSFFSDYL